MHETDRKYGTLGRQPREQPPAYHILPRSSYLLIPQDTPDLLRKFEEGNEEGNLPPGAKPFSIDIKSLYTNILLREVIEAFKEMLDEIPGKSIPTEYLI